MKTLESITTSLDVSKKLDTALKKANIKVEPLFWWVDKFPVFNDKERIATDSELKTRLEDSPLSEEAKKLIKTYPALTATEIGAILPMVLTSEDMGNAPEYGEMYLEIWHDSYGWRLTYRNDNEQSILDEPINSNTMSDAMGEMLYYLIDNQLLEK
jgi:hypothetical protein